MRKAYDSSNYWRNIPDYTSPISADELNKIDIAVVYGEETQHIRPKFSNCKNCGAPLKTDECEYCGTQY